MPVKLGQLLKSLSSKMKLNQEDELVKKLFEVDLEVDDTIAAEFEQKLMTSEAALANTAIRSKIKAEVLNGMDAIIDELTGEYEFDDASKDEVKNAGTTFQKQKVVAKKIAELQEKKAGTGTKKDKEAIQKQIDDLNGAMVKLKETHATEIANVSKAKDDEIYNIRFVSKLENKKYYNEDVPVAIHALTAKQLVNQNLAKSGAKLVWDEALQNFKLLNAETNVEYHDPNNKKVSPDEFIDGVLAENKMLKTSTPGSPADPNNPIIIPAAGGDQKNVNNSMLNAIDAQLG
jgi:hypothetical protein